VDSDEEAPSSTASSEDSPAPGCCDEVRACRVRIGLRCFGLVSDPLASLQLVGIDCSRYYGAWAHCCCCIACFIAIGIVLFFFFKLQTLLGAGTIIGVLPWLFISCCLGSYFCVLVCTTSAGIRTVMSAVGRTSSDPERPQRVLAAYDRRGDFDTDVGVLDVNSARTLRLLVKSHDEVIMDALKIGFNTNILEKFRGDDRSQHFLLASSLLGADDPESVNQRLRVIVNDKEGMDVYALDDVPPCVPSFSIDETLRQSGVKWQRALSTVLLPMARSRAVLLRWALGQGFDAPIGMDFHWIKQRVGRTLDAVDEMNVARLLIVPPREELLQTVAEYDAMAGEAGTLLKHLRTKRMKSLFRAGFLALLEGTVDSSESLRSRLQVAVAGKHKHELLQLLCRASEEFIQSLPTAEKESILGVFGENLEEDDEEIGSLHSSERVSSTTVPTSGSAPTGPLVTRSPTISSVTSSSRFPGPKIRAAPGLFDWLVTRCGPQAAEQFEIALEAAEHAVEVAYEAVEEQAEQLIEHVKGPSSGHLARMLLNPAQASCKKIRKDVANNRAWQDKTILSKRYLAEIHYCIERKDAIGLVGLLMHLEDEQRLLVQERYEDAYGDDEEDSLSLARAICTSMRRQGEMEVILLGMVRSPEWVWARTLWEACCGGLIGLGTDEETLTSVIVLNWDRKRQLKDALLTISKWKGKQYTLQGLIDSEIENASFKLIMHNLLDEGWC